MLPHHVLCFELRSDLPPGDPYLYALTIRSISGLLQGITTIKGVMHQGNYHQGNYHQGGHASGELPDYHQQGGHAPLMLLGITYY